MNKRVGILGGSFDPIHLGHLSLAIEMQEKHRLDQVYLLPALLNPNKFVAHTPGSGFASPEQRLQMVKLAVRDIPGLDFSEAEYARTGPSYTVDTLRFLAQQQSAPTDLFLIIGADAAANLHRWREPDQIIALARLLVGVRQPMAPEFNRWQGSDELVAAIREGLTPTRNMQISATEIRSRLAQGLYCGHLMPAKVLDYIHANQLYYTTE